jgi:sugar/nucleoside kinase (ribokinase family)
LYQDSIDGSTGICTEHARTHHVSERQDPTTEVVCVGEALWDLFAPADTPLAQNPSLRMNPGGGAVNVALGLAGRGIRAGLCAALGDDPVGRALAESVASRGVDISRVAFVRARTGLVIVASAPPGAVAYRSPVEESRALAEALPTRWDARLVHVSGLPPSRAAIAALRRAARRARQEGALVTVDVNARPRLFPREVVLRVDPSSLLAEADVVQASADDLRVLGIDPGDPLATLGAHLGRGAVLVVTDGPRRVRAFIAADPSIEIARAVEPLHLRSAIGAGDAFATGLVSALARAARVDRASIEEAITRGIEVARDMLRARA